MEYKQISTSTSAKLHIKSANVAHIAKSTTQWLDDKIRQIGQRGKNCKVNNSVVDERDPTWYESKMHRSINLQFSTIIMKRAAT